MSIKLGSLIIFSVKERTDLLSTSVKEAVLNLPDVDKIGVAEIDPGLSDTLAFCNHYQVAMEQAANCVILKTKGAQSKFAACVVLGNTRADVNGLARKTLDAKVSFAPMEDAVLQTNMEYGAITPIGLPNSWTILADKAIVDSEYVIIGSGLRKSKLIIPGNVLATLPNAKVLEGLGQIKL